MYIQQVISQKYATKLGGGEGGRGGGWQTTILGTEGQKDSGKISFTDF